MNFNRTKQYTVTVAFISLGMGVLIHFNNILSLFMTQNIKAQNHVEHFGSNNVLANVITTTLITFSIFMLNFFILKPFGNSRGIKPGLIIKSLILTLVSVFVLSEFFFTINHFITQENESFKFHVLYIFKDIFIAVIVIITVLVFKIFHDKQVIAIENEKLKIQNLQSQYQTLKNQVSPHFLFNSLTALKELTDENPVNAGKYIGHLSNVLRYTLQSNEHRTVSLYNELETVYSYLFLIKMRFGENLKVDFKTDEKYNLYRIPPLAVQTLIENAVKHNEVSRRNTLIISIFTTEDESLAVTNNICEKITTEPGTGIGLSNLVKQYQLLSGKEILITKTENEFRVEVPLLKPE